MPVYQLVMSCSQTTSSFCFSQEIPTTCSCGLAALRPSRARSRVQPLSARVPACCRGNHRPSVGDMDGGGYRSLLHRFHLRSSQTLLLESCILLQDASNTL